jgi:LacI family transcriptional regulator
MFKICCCQELKISPKKSRPSIQDVARLASVSLGTVSNVLNYPDRVKPKTREKVNAAIRELGFIRNDAARQLKAGKSKTLGMIVLDAANPFFAELSRGSEEEAESQNYSLLLGNSGQQPERESRYFKLFQEQRISGILVSPIEDVSEAVQEMRAVGTHTVLVDRRADPALCCSVSVDDIAGGRMAVEHLLLQGYRSIVFVAGPLEIQQVADRLSGAQEAIRTSKTSATLRVITTPNLDVINGRRVGDQIIKEPREAWPDAVFAANDLLAVGLLQAFAYRGSVKVPDEIGLIGYDDIDFAQSTIVPLTSIKQPAKLLGSTGVEMLIEEIENPEQHRHRQITFQPELVVRESTARKLER